MKTNPDSSAIIAPLAVALFAAAVNVQVVAQVANGTGVPATIAGRAVNKASQPAVSPDSANISYGPYKRNTLDFWRAKTDKPAPVFVFFHGGGLVGGDKADYQIETLARMLKECPQSGIAFVSADYRLVVGDGAAHYPTPMLDGARVVQFLRSKAKDWNIDPEHIAIGGESAGANISLWIALHADLANPKADDPVLRESSRVACVISWFGQTSNDPHFIRQVLGGPKTDPPALLPFYGVKTREELETPAMRQVVEDASAVNHASKSAPPVLLSYGQMIPLPLPETTDWGTVLHHPAFGKLLKDKLDPLGVPCQLYYGASRMPDGADLQFLKKYLLVTAQQQDEAVPSRETKVAQSLVDAALKKAKADGKILMVEFGANWCEDCVALSRHLDFGDSGAYFQKHFTELKVDVGRFNKNLDIAKALNVDLGKGIPTAVFFAPEGVRIGDTNKGELESSSKYSTKQILSFLKDIAERRLVTSPDGGH